MKPEEDEQKIKRRRKKPQNTDNDSCRNRLLRLHIILNKNNANIFCPPICWVYYILYPLIHTLQGKCGHSYFTDAQIEALED